MAAVDISEVNAGDDVVVIIKGKTLKGKISSIGNGSGRIYSVLMKDSGETRSVARNQIKSFKRP